MTPRTFLIAALLVGYPCADFGQAGQPAPALTSTIHTSTTLVQVPALVQTASTEIVHNLTASDFSLTDDGVSQVVHLESESQAPLSLVVLMQTGGAANAQFRLYSRLETMLEPLLAGSQTSPNQVAIVNFDSRIEGATSFTPDIAHWSDALNHPDSGDRGAAIFDALAYAFDLLDKQPAANRRAILLLSQPTDEGSKTPAKEILRSAAETNTAIYSFTFSPENTTFKDQLKGAPHSHPAITVNPAAGPIVGYFELSLPLNMLLAGMRKNVAAEMATLTGGETVRFNNQQELDTALGTLSNHIRNRYLLTFTPTSNRPGLHNLQVRMNNDPRLTVSARTSYWAAAP